MWQIGIATFGMSTRFTDYPDDEPMQNHVSSVWVFWIIFCVIFLLLTGGLTFYHSFLITTNQSTWEHTVKSRITYLKPYKSSILPFYISIWVNVKSTFFHGGRATEWKLR